MLKHILFVKLSVYINYCKAVHKHGIYASSSRNCSHWRAWREKLGRLVTDQHGQDTKLIPYVFILYPNSKATSPAMNSRIFTISCTKENSQQRYRMPSAARMHGAQTIPAKCCTESHCATREHTRPARAAGFLCTPSTPPFGLRTEICTASSCELPDEFILCGNYIFSPFKRVREAEYGIQELWWVGVFLSDWFCSTVCPIFISLLL